MLTSYDVATHWPFIRSHLLLDRQPAVDRALRLLAEQLVVSGGDPVPMSGRRLRVLGLTPGEAGNAWAALTELERAGAVGRYRGAGRRPDLWAFAGALAERWRLPWRWGGREVEIVVKHCSCRATIAFAARLPGHSVAASAGIEEFELPAEAHLDFRGDFRATSAERRAETAEPTRENGTSPRGNGANSAPPIPLPGSSFGTTHHHDDEEPSESQDGRAVARAVTELTGAPLIGSPRRRLMAAVATGLDPVRVVDELGRLPTPTFMLCVARVEQLARDGFPVPRNPERANVVARAERDRLARLAEEYRQAGELEEAAFYEQRLAPVGTAP